VAYGLRVDGVVDERRDPEKSTRSAVSYLKDLYRRFDCWYLAAAGYNAGEGRVEGAMMRHDTHDFWAMAQQKLLPLETCNYVPQLIAVALIAKNPEKYGFDRRQRQAPQSSVQVKVPGDTDLKWFAQNLAIPYKSLRELNPELNQDRTPQDSQFYLLKIPASKKNEADRIAHICWKNEPE
jgi:membrane-bound lytic murein transglycosylase D